MAVLLSGVPFRSASVRLIDFGAFLRPPLGGPVQRIERLGNRFAIDVEVPPLREEPDGRLFTAKLQQALSEGAAFAFPQPGLNIATSGTPVVDGDVPSGSIIPISGLTAGSIFRYGQYISIVHGAQRYLYRAKAETLAGSDGRLSLSVMPMLRTPLANGDVIEIVPVIEGWIEAPQWTLMTAPFTDTKFTITERA